MAVQRNNTGATGNRLFFALWPDDDVRQALGRTQRGLPAGKGVKSVVPQNLHITLNFLGTINQNKQACVQAAAADIKVPAFSLHIDTLVFRRKQRMVWLEPSNMPAALLPLVTGIETACRNCGIETEDRPYKAHLTIMRKVKSFPPDISIEPIIWPINSFVLVSSQTLPEGAVYQIVERWSLTSGVVNQND